MRGALVLPTSLTYIQKQRNYVNNIKYCFWTLEPIVLTSIWIFRQLFRPSGHIVAAIIYMGYLRFHHNTN